LKNQKGKTPFPWPWFLIMGKAQGACFMDILPWEPGYFDCKLYMELYYWKHNRQWYKSQAVLLCVGIDPNKIEIGADGHLFIVPDDEFGPHEFDMDWYTKKAERITNLLNQAIEVNDIEILNNPNTQDPEAEYHINPLTFIRWLSDRNLPCYSQFDIGIEGSEKNIPNHIKPVDFINSPKSKGGKISEPFTPLNTLAHPIPTDNEVIYIEFIKNTKISLNQQDETKVSITPYKGNPFTSTKEELGFKGKSNEGLWPIVRTILEDGKYNFSRTPKQRSLTKDKKNFIPYHTTKEDTPSFEDTFNSDEYETPASSDTNYKRIHRIKIKFIDYFNRKFKLSIRQSYQMFESKENGYYPAFRTNASEELEYLERVIHSTGQSVINICY
jgi:hypothetical protein